MLKMSGDLPRQIPTYPQALQRAGYSTAGIGKFHWLQTWPWGTPPGEGLDLVAMKEDLKSFGFDYVWECSGKQLSVENYCDFARHLDDKGQLNTFRDHVLSRGKNNNLAKHVEFTGEPWPLAEEDYPDTVTADRMIDWLDAQNDQDTPFFLFGSFVSPHQPHDPPQRYLDQIPYEEVDDFVTGDDEEPLDDKTKKRMWKLRRSYKAMVKLVDDQVGRVLDKLEEMGELEDTIILFVADHGEMLGDHGRFQKSIHWHQSAVVPCAIRHPDFLNASRIDTPVEFVDLTSTILEAAGLDPVHSISRDWPSYQDIVPGKSLMPLIQGETDRIRDFAFCEYTTEWTMIHSDRYSYVRRPTNDPDKSDERLFDLVSDPNECHNLSNQPDLQETLAWHRNRLFHVMDTHPPAQTSWAEYGKSED